MTAKLYSGIFVLNVRKKLRKIRPLICLILYRLQIYKEVILNLPTQSKESKLEFRQNSLWSLRGSW